MRLVFVVLLLLAPALNAAEPIATVNDATISEEELEGYLARFAAQQGTSVDRLREAPQFAQIREAMLTQLIQRELLWQAAQEKHRISDAELDRAVAQTEQRLGGPARLDRALRAQGMDRDQLRRQLLQELSIERYLEERVYAQGTVTDAAVARFYRDNPERFRSPDLLHLRMVRLAGTDADTRSRAEALRQRLSAGEPLESMEGYAADLGFLNAEDLGAELGAAAAKLQTGTVSEPVMGPDAVYLLELVERREGIQAPLEAVAERIRGDLTRERREQALAAHVETLREAARVTRP